MREINVQKITEVIKKLCMETNYYLGDDVVEALKKALEVEESPIGKEIINQILENSYIARKEKVAMCQDTGFTVVFLELGQNVNIIGGNFYEAVNEGVRQGYREGYLRKSIVSDPLERKNTGDNTPAVIHTKIVPGDKLKIIIAPKGGGSENMSEVKMMAPAQGIQGVEDFVSWGGHWGNVREMCKSGKTGFVKDSRLKKPQSFLCRFGEKTSGKNKLPGHWPDGIGRKSNRFRCFYRNVSLPYSKPACGGKSAVPFC